MRYLIGLFLTIVSLQAESAQTVFYCAYQIDKCIEKPLSLTKIEIEKIIPSIAEGKSNFIGFIDEQAIIFQFYVDEIDKIWVEIPYPKEKGSYGIHINTAEFYSLIKELRPPFIQYKSKLGLKFKAW